MSDMTTTDTGASSVAPTSAPPSSSPPSPTATGDVFSDLPVDQAVFDRGYVERIRREGQRYRNEGQQATQMLEAYNRAFGDYDPEDRQVWLDLASTWMVDPNRAAQVMQNIAQAVLQPEGGEDPAAPTPRSNASPGDQDGLDEMTPAQLQQMITEALEGQRQQAQEQQAVNEVY